MGLGQQLFFLLMTYFCSHLLLLSTRSHISSTVLTIRKAAAVAAARTMTSLARTHALLSFVISAFPHFCSQKQQLSRGCLLALRITFRARLKAELRRKKASSSTKD